MPSGGHARSGPAPDPNSLKSAKSRNFTALPSEGYQGEIPPFPLPASAGNAVREAELWEWAWRTPQAQAWSVEPWRWMAVAMWVRTHAVCESEEATAADKNSLHRFAEDIGLSPAGMARNGWVIAKDQIAERREERPAPVSSARSRLSAVRDAAGGA